MALLFSSRKHKLELLATPGLCIFKGMHIKTDLMIKRPTSNKVYWTHSQETTHKWNILEQTIALYGAFNLTY